MKHSRKILFFTFLIGISILSACGNSSDASVNESSNNHLNEELSNNESENEDQQTTENENNNGANEQDTTDNTMDENGATNQSETNSKEKVSSESSKVDNEMSNRENYVKKLNETKKELDELEVTDSSTYALKNKESERWETWDDLLNEVYGVLQDELSVEEMDLLREEQRNWIEHRDDTALEASEKYKGGTQEHVEYVSVLANLTEQRCYELVGNYME